ncbi:hypothetical protein ABK040_007344 [Willaertia magna]
MYREGKVKRSIEIGLKVPENEYLKAFGAILKIVTIYLLHNGSMINKNVKILFIGNNFEYNCGANNFIFLDFGNLPKLSLQFFNLKSDFFTIYFMKIKELSFNFCNFEAVFIKAFHFDNLIITNSNFENILINGYSFLTAQTFTYLFLDNFLLQNTTIKLLSKIYLIVADFQLLDNEIEFINFILAPIKVLVKNNKFKNTDFQISTNNGIENYFSLQKIITTTLQFTKNIFEETNINLNYLNDKLPNSNTIIFINENSFSGNYDLENALKISGFDFIYIFNNIFKNNLQQNTLQQKIIRKDHAIAIISIFINSIVIENCKFLNWITMEYGGALSVDAPLSIIELNQCEFINNLAGYGGGAISIFGSNLIIIKNSIFKQNKVTATQLNTKNNLQFGGGAIFIYKSKLLLENSQFIENESTFAGGALAQTTSCTLNITNNYFLNNRAIYGGAIAFLSNVGYTTCLVRYNEILNNQFIKNLANVFGGALFIRTGMLDLFENNYLFLNYANVSGNGLFLVDNYNLQNNNNLKNVFGNDIATFPVKVEIKNSEDYNNNYNVYNNNNNYKNVYNNNAENELLEVYPGEEVIHKFILKDSFNNIIPYIPNEYTLSLTGNEIYFLIFKINYFHPYLTIQYNYRTENSNLNNLITNITMTITFKDFELKQSIPFKISTCAVGTYLVETTGSGSTTNNNNGNGNNGNIVYYCSPKITIIISSVIGGFLLMSFGFLLGLILLKLLTKMLKIVKSYKKKEKSEFELQQKLMDFQTIFEEQTSSLYYNNNSNNNNISNESSYAKWIINVEDLEIKTKIGEGGGGTVYRAVWKSMHDVAMKSVKLNDNDMSSDAFEHEASLLRDLKPENILLGEFLAGSMAKVTDFGVSKIASNSVRTMTCNIGTLKKLLKLEEFTLPFVMNDIYNGFRLPIPTINDLQLINEFTRIYFNNLNYNNGINNTNTTANSVNSLQQEKLSSVIVNYFELVDKCWQQDFTKRPTFHEIMLNLKKMYESL